jgi:hypothetical protein
MPVATPGTPGYVPANYQDDCRQVTLPGSTMSDAEGLEFLPPQVQKMNLAILIYEMTL